MRFLVETYHIHLYEQIFFMAFLFYGLSFLFLLLLIHLIIFPVLFYLF